MTSLRNGRPITFRPRGLSDTVDGTAAPPGSMSILQNLVPDPGTKNAYVCRPGGVQVTDFSGFTLPTAVNCLLVIGDIAYGMLASSDYPGKDEPFIYNIATNTFVAITGQSSANLPTSPSLTGNWTPPTAAMIGNRVLFTHPGFTGGADPYFGWLDFTDFSSTTLSGNVTSGSNVITSITGDGTSSPVLDGVQPGQNITAGGLFPAGTTVVSASNGTFDESTTCDLTSASPVVTSIPSTTGLLPGMYVSGVDIPPATWIISVDSSTQVTLNNAALGNSTGGDINFSGGGTITVSNNATGSANIQPLDISGGSPAAPIWNAGNLNVFPLVAVPVAVCQFNDRAYFAVLNGVAFSDVLNPLNASNADQVLTMGDSTPVTALSGLPLSNQVTGGVVQSLICFKGASVLYQVAGDAATGNLSQNAIEGSVGTLAPNTICATPQGLAYVAPDGLRILSLTAIVTEPIGSYGDGVREPFIEAVNASRMCANYNQNVIRISVQNGAAPGEPWQEYWYDFNLKVWTGPHTAPNALIEAWESPTAAATGSAFLSAPQQRRAALLTSAALPTELSSYEEFGGPLTWQWQTSLLPDNSTMSMNCMVQASLACELAGGDTINVLALDEAGDILDTVPITGSGAGDGIWGTSVWGDFDWGASSAPFEQQRIPWHIPIVFKQMFINIVGSSDADTTLGNLYMRWQELGYFLDR